VHRRQVDRPVFHVDDQAVNPAGRQHLRHGDARHGYHEGGDDLAGCQLCLHAVDAAAVSIHLGQPLGDFAFDYGTMETKAVNAGRPDGPAGRPWAPNGRVKAGGSSDGHHGDHAICGQLH